MKPAEFVEIPISFTACIERQLAEDYFRLPEPSKVELLAKMAKEISRQLSGQICHNLETGNFVYQQGFFPAEQDLPNFIDDGLNDEWDAIAWK